jgi:hypothetical protein
MRLTNMKSPLNIVGHFSVKHIPHTQEISVKLVRFEIFIAVDTKITAFWYVILCGLVEVTDVL